MAVAMAVVEEEATVAEVVATLQGTTIDDLLPLPETMMTDEVATLAATPPGEMTTDGTNLEGMTEGKSVLPGETTTETGALLDEMIESDTTVLPQVSPVAGLRKYVVALNFVGMELRDSTATSSSKYLVRMDAAKVRM